MVVTQVTTGSTPVLPAKVRVLPRQPIKSSMNKLTFNEDKYCLLYPVVNGEELPIAVEDHEAEYVKYMVEDFMGYKEEYFKLIVMGAARIAMQTPRGYPKIK